MAVATPVAVIAQGLTLELEPVAVGLTRPLAVADPGDGSGRLFVVQQTGEVLIFNGAALESTPFLDLSGDIACCGERGLLGFAFHPQHASNGRFYVNFTDPTGDTRVVEYQVSAGDPDVADPTTARVLLAVDQPYTNHNGGDLHFGPDGYLYVALGDGGSGGDPDGNGQDPTTLLGSILRIDVDSTDPPLEYAIPADNPFVGDPNGRDEIWVYGLRNPWRFSFDRRTGDLFIGDVGQGTLEEIDLQPAASPGGENYGWNVMEGSSCYNASTCDTTGLVLPILEYGRSLGRSVTGGYRSRGAAQPRLDGVYLFADYVLGTVWGTVPRCDGQWEAQTLLESGVLVSSFGEDAAGGLFLVQYSSGATGAVHRLVLAGDPGGPAVATNPDPVEVQPVHLDETGTVEVLISNTNGGPEAAFVADLVLADTTRFSLDPNGGSSPCGSLSPCLSPGDGCTVTVGFSSPVEGAFDTTLTVTGNLDPVTVPVSGRAYVPCVAGDDVVLAPQTVTGSPPPFEACRTLTTTDPFEITSGADVTFVAGERITLASGFSVASGGVFTAVIDPVLTLP